jgi:hypothetical protein
MMGRLWTKCVTSADVSPRGKPFEQGNRMVDGDRSSPAPRPPTVNYAPWIIKQIVGRRSDSPTRLGFDALATSGHDRCLCACLAVD